MKQEKMMKSMKFALLAVAFTSGTVMAQSHSTQGYFKKDGTYVAPSVATNPNGTKADNYSSKGNTNPLTGKEGTVDPYKIEPYKYEPVKTRK